MFGYCGSIRLQSVILDIILSFLLGVNWFDPDTVCRVIAWIRLNGLIQIQYVGLLCGIRLNGLIQICRVVVAVSG